MPSLISTADVLERFDISDDIDVNRIAPHVGAASRRLRNWVGETAYANAATDDSQYADLREDLKNAEAHLAYHYALRGLNFPLSSKGIVATSMASEGREMRKYLTPQETSEVAQQLLELAREIAEPYLLADGSPTATFELVEYGEC